MEIWDDLSKEDLDACFVIIEMQNQTEMKNVAADEEPTMEEAKKILAEATEAAVKVHPDLERFSPTKDSILFTKKLMNLFCNVRDPTTFYAEYPKESPHSSQYFGISQKHAALLMIKVFDAIVKSNEHQSYDEVQTAENITDREEGDSNQIVCDSGLLSVDSACAMSGTALPIRPVVPINSELDNGHTVSNYVDHTMEFPVTESSIAICKEVKIKTKHVDSFEPNFPCTKCSKAFKRGDHLKRHILNVHDQDHPYHCRDCSKGFANVETLSKHNETSHFGIVSKGLFCAWCGLKFSCMDDLKSHADSMHKTQDEAYMDFINKTCRVFGCTFCQKTVSSEKILARHIEKAHRSGSKDGKVICNKCNVDFSSASELNKHKTLVHKNHEVKKMTSKKSKVAPLNGNLQHVQQQFEQSCQFSNSMQNGTVNNHNILQSTSTMHSFMQDKLTLSQGQVINHNTLPRQTSNTMKTQVETAMSTPSAQAGVLKKIYNLTENSFQLKPVAETASVSEALSSAMKALSDFSYDELSCDAQDYVPAGFSTFQSSSPIPIFHYPTTVQCSNIIDDEQSSTTQQHAATSMNSFPLADYAGDTTVSQSTIQSTLGQKPHMSQSSLPYQITVSIQSQNNYIVQNTNNGISNASQPKDDETVNHLQARRGRPKKRRTDGEVDEQLTLNMFVKTLEDGKYYCEICNEAFENVNHTMRHIENVHLVAKPQECCICMKHFAQAGNVKRHIRFVHLRERPFQCSDCDSTFDRLCYLQRHMRCHVDSNKPGQNNSYLNPCNCPECGKRCLTVLHLKGHLQRRHYPKSKNCSEELELKYGHIFQDIEDSVALTKKAGSSAKSKIKLNPHNTNASKSASDISVKNAIETDDTSNILHMSSSETIVQMLQNESIQTKGDQLKNLPSSSSQLKKTYPGNSDCNINPTNQDIVMESKKNISRKVNKKANFSVFCSKKIILGHRNRKCSFLLPFKCHICACRSFPSLCLLKSHIAVVHHSTMRRHLCLHCGRNYSTKSSLVDHVTKRHQKHKFVFKKP